MIIQDIDLLKKRCENASLIEAPGIILQLEEVLKNSSTPGVGLSANQIGINKKICIIRHKEAINLINPIITEKIDLREFRGEGCLSFPDQWIKTKRFNEIVVADDLHPFGIICTELEAVIVQHEVGHLYGETMFDYEIPELRPNDKCWCGSDIKYKKCHSNKYI